MLHASITGPWDAQEHAELISKLLFMMKPKVLLLVTKHITEGEVYFLTERQPV